MVWVQSGHGSITIYDAYGRADGYLSGEVQAAVFFRESQGFVVAEFPAATVSLVEGLAASVWLDWAGTYPAQFLPCDSMPHGNAPWNWLGRAF
jgi:hypothetical protein